MAAAPQPTPLEVYRSSSFEPDAEFVDGAIEERPMGEYDHSSWQHALEFWFGSHAAEWGIRVRPELRIQVAPDRYRVPDVAILDRSREVEQIVTQPPIAVFEILSPVDTLSRMMKKLEDYKHMGVRNILIIDPKARNYRFCEGRLEPLAAPSFDLAGSACRFDLAEIEKLLD